MSRTWVFVVVALAAGCAKKKPEPAAAGSGSGSAAVATAPTDAAVAVEPVAAELVPKKLTEKEGVIFAETAGGMVSGIKDGTKVPVVAVKELGVGDQEDGTVTVSNGGKNVELKADRVLLEDDIERSPDGKFLVFKPIVACGDLCHTVVWFVGLDGKRVKLGDGGPDVNISYHPKGGTVAIGSGSLWLVNLADFTVKHYDDFLSPAYGADGTLYVRNSDGSAFKLDGDTKPKRVWKAPKTSAEEDEEGGGGDPKPVGFDKAGKPKYDLTWYEPGM